MQVVLELSGINGADNQRKRFFCFPPDSFSHVCQYFATDWVIMWGKDELGVLALHPTPSVCSVPSWPLR